MRVFLLHIRPKHSKVNESHQEHVYSWIIIYTMSAENLVSHT